jgi:predicted GNAT family N-acyltransferase
MSAYTLRRGAPIDYPDMIDFANYVFKTDFPALLPKLYGDHADLAADHVLVTEQTPNGERIRAMVGCFKLPLHVGNKTLDMRGIGTVSVHPYARSKGYMKAAMHRALADAEADGADLIVLSGRRQRYQHYGFDKCATQFDFLLNRAVSEQLQRYGVEGITAPVDLSAYRLLSAADSESYTAQCAALYNAQPVHAERADFAEVARSWSSEVRVLLRDGQFLGYGTLGGDGERVVNEFVLNDWTAAIPAALALFDASGAGTLLFNVQPFQTELLRAMLLIAESAQIVAGHNINVLSYPKVIEAFLQLKADRGPLPDGRYVIDVVEKGKTEITVQNGIVSAAPAPAEAAADITLPHLQMMNFLFSPAGPLALRGNQPALEKAWFPIPLSFSEQDNV